MNCPGGVCSMNAGLSNNLANGLDWQLPSQFANLGPSPFLNNQFAFPKRNCPGGVCPINMPPPSSCPGGVCPMNMPPPSSCPGGVCPIGSFNLPQTAPNPWNLSQQASPFFNNQFNLQRKNCPGGVCPLGPAPSFKFN